MRAVAARERERERERDKFDEARTHASSGMKLRSMGRVFPSRPGKARSKDRASPRERTRRECEI